MITSGAALFIANPVDRPSISMMGSAGFLLIFAAVNGANAALADKAKSRRSVSLVGAGLCIGALGSLIRQTADSSPGQRWFLVAMIAAALSVEIMFRLFTGRTISLSKADRNGLFDP